MGFEIYNKCEWGLREPEATSMDSDMLVGTTGICQYRAMCPFFLRQGRLKAVTPLGWRNPFLRFLRNGSCYGTTRNPSIVELEACLGSILDQVSGPAPLQG